MRDYEFQLNLPGGAAEVVTLDGVGGFTQAAHLLWDAAQDTLGCLSPVTIALSELCASMDRIPLTDNELRECGAA